MNTNNVLSHKLRLKNCYRVQEFNVLVVMVVMVNLSFS